MNFLDLAKETFKTRQNQYFESIAEDESSGHGSSKYFLQGFFFESNYQRYNQTTQCATQH